MIEKLIRSFARFFLILDMLSVFCATLFMFSARQALVALLVLLVGTLTALFAWCLLMGFAELIALSRETEANTRKLLLLEKQKDNLK